MSNYKSNSSRPVTKKKQADKKPLADQQITSLPLDKSQLLDLIHELQDNNSELVRHNKQLIQNKEFRSFFENSPEGFAFCRMIYKEKVPVDFVYLDVNPAFYTLTGLTDVTGCKFTKIFPDSGGQHSKLLQLYHSVVATGISQRFEIYFEPLHSWLSISVLRPEEGCFIALFDNITESKRAEQRTRESEESYRQLFEQSPSGIALYQDGKFVFANPAGLSIMGCSGPGDIIGKPVLNFVHPDSQADVIKRMGMVAKGITIPPLEEKLIRLDGSEFQAEVIPTHTTFNGKHAGQIIVTDISIRKQVESALKESEAKYRKLVDEVHDGYIVSNAGGVITYANNALIRILGFDEPSSVVGHNFLEFIPPKNAENNNQIYRSAMLTGQDPELEITQIRRADGSIRHLEMRPQVNLINGRPSGMQSIIRDVTDRKLAENALQRSEAKLNAIIQNSRDAIGVHIHGVWVMCNPAALKLFGVSEKAELLGTSILNVLASGERLRIAEYVQRRYRGEEAPTKYQTIGLRKDGTQFDLEVTISSFSLEDQQNEYMLLRDVSEQLHNEKTLRESEQLYHAMFDKTQAIKLIIDPDNGTIVDANPAAAAFYGYTVDALKALKIENINLLPVKEVKAEMKKALREKRSCFNFRHRLANGTVRDVEVFSSPLTINGRHLLHSIINDITNRKQAEDALRFQSEIVENMAEGIVLIKISDSTIVYTNPNFDRMFGYETGELRGSPIGRINAPDTKDPDEKVNNIVDVLNGKGIWKCEIHNLKKDGTLFWCQANVSTYRHPEYGEVWVAVHEDITARKHAEEEIKKLQDELEQKVIERTYKLESANIELEKFSYSASHEIRTPLRAMNGYASLLLEDYSPVLDSEGKRMLKLIVDNANMMGKLIDDLLLFSHYRPQEIKFSKVNMQALAQQAYDELVTDVEKETIVFNLHDIPVAQANKTMMLQVWRNLIGNAIKFSSRKQVPVIEIGSITKDESTLFYVKDNGIGFDMAHADMLFRIFKRLPGAKHFEGTGVGLSIVMRIIQSFKGEIWAEGTVGKGATFYFTLGSQT